MTKALKISRLTRAGRIVRHIRLQDLRLTSGTRILVEPLWIEGLGFQVRLGLYDKNGQPEWFTFYGIKLHMIPSATVTTNSLMKAVEGGLVSTVADALLHLYSTIIAKTATLSIRREFARGVGIGSSWNFVCTLKLGEYESEARQPNFPCFRKYFAVK